MKYPDLLLFNSRALQAILKSRVESIAAAKNGWQGPLGIFIGLLSTFLVTEFQDRFGVSKTHWSALFFAAALISAFWTLWGLFKTLKLPSFKVFFEELYRESLTKENRRIIFLFKALDANGIARVLTYSDPVWGCSLLPNARRSEAVGSELNLEEMLSSRFGGASDSFSISNLENSELISFKISQRNKEYTMYLFDFYLVKIGEDLISALSRREFRIGSGVLYKWMSLDEMNADSQMMAKNSDIINHLSEHYEETMSPKIPWSINGRLGD